MRLGIGLMLNLFYYNYATNFVLFVDFRPADMSTDKQKTFPGATPVFAERRNKSEVFKK